MLSKNPSFKKIRSSAVTFNLSLMVMMWERDDGTDVMLHAIGRCKQHGSVF